MKKWVNRRYGTSRGLVRALLGQLELATGRLRPFTLRQPDQVRRVVFVCRGNICRSAFAHHEALKYGMNVASLGLATSSGRACPTATIAGAARAGVDLSAHRARSWPDFDVRSGDLFLATEVRQAHELRRLLGTRDDVQVCLLGMWCTPAMPHLHDPYTLSDAYLDRCFERVSQAIRKLSAELSDVRTSAGRGAGRGYRSRKVA